jgi:hypothetical protein
MQSLRSSCFTSDTPSKGNVEAECHEDASARVAPAPWCAKRRLHYANCKYAVACIQYLPPPHQHEESYHCWPEAHLTLMPAELAMDKVRRKCFGKHSATSFMIHHADRHFHVLARCSSVWKNALSLPLHHQCWSTSLLVSFSPSTPELAAPPMSETPNAGLVKTSFKISLSRRPVYFEAPRMHLVHPLNERPGSALRMALTPENA